MKGLRVDFFPLPELYKEPEPWYNQRPFAPVCLLGKSRWIWAHFSRFSDFSCWLIILSFIWRYIPGTCTLPSERYLGGGCWKIAGTTHPMERYWVRLSWKMLGNIHPGEGYGGRGWFWLKYTRFFFFFFFLVVGDSVAFSEWLKKRLIRYFPSIWLT